MILLSEILGCKNPCTGYPAENAEIIHKDQLIDDRRTGHLLCTDPPDHNIIQKTDKIRDTILDHDRHRNGQNHQIKLLIPYELPEKRCFFFYLLHNFPPCSFRFPPSKILHK